MARGRVAVRHPCQRVPATGGLRGRLDRQFARRSVAAASVLWAPFVRCGDRLDADGHCDGVTIRDCEARSQLPGSKQS